MIIEFLVISILTLQTQIIFAIIWILNDIEYNKQSSKIELQNLQKELINLQIKFSKSVSEHSNEIHSIKKDIIDICNYLKKNGKNGKNDKNEKNDAKKSDFMLMTDYLHG